ncbi:protein ROH1A-like [Carex rostrata]
MAMAGESPGTSTGFLGLLSFRRNQIVSLEPTPQDELDSLEHFQLEVTSRLVSLLSSDDSSPFLSLSFLSKLLDSLLCTEHEFRSLLPVLLSRNPSILSKPPSDKLANDLLDRAVKSLDLCNAVSLSLQAMRHSHRQARIAASCLLQSDHIGEAQMSRARRALKKLLGGAFHRTGSSGRGGGSGGSGSSISRDMHSKSLSFSVSRNWSARQQVQAMAAHLAPPRQATVTDTASGLAMAVYTMSSLLVFVMWVLVSAVPCHERLSTNGTTNATAPPPPPPKHLQWAAPMMTLQDKITEEWKRKDKKTSGGLLAEMQTVESSARWLMEWVEEGVKEGGPLIEEDRAKEVTARASELEEACELLEEGLEPFERQVRAVFHRVVSSRAEVIRYLDDSVRSARAHGHGNAGHPPLHGAGLPPMP